MRVFITLGEDKFGSFSPIYVGDDGEKATQAMENPPAGIVQAFLLRNPMHDRHRDFPDRRRNAPIPSPVEEKKIEEKKSKLKSNQ